jgi:hypothetical protein
MLFVKIIIATMLVFAMAASVYQIAKRVKVKPIIPGNVPWIFYLIEKMFGENDSSSKEVKKNELPKADQCQDKNVRF